MGNAEERWMRIESNICRKLEIHGQHALARYAARHRADL